MLRTIKKEYGWIGASLAVWGGLTSRGEDCKSFRGYLYRNIARIVRLPFAIWLGVLIKPWVVGLWKDAMEGVVFRWPKCPLTFPAITRNTLFTWEVFFNYGWIVLAVAWLLRARSRILHELIEAIEALWYWSGTVVLGIAAYASVFGDHYGNVTTDQYFEIGKYLPVVMPMWKFLYFGVGNFLAVSICAFWEMATHGQVMSQASRDQALTPSEALGGLKEQATSEDLRKAGLL